MEQVLELVAEAFGISVAALREHGRRAGIAKQVAAELAALYCGISQREVGRALGYRGNGAVGKQRACLRIQLAGNPVLAKRLHSLKEKLSRA